ncbi:MAG: CinA family protein [Campylobacterales bacterium]|nr:CinA family protein [Campylobacterales bacterium]
MKNCLMIIGEGIKLSEIFIEYLLREVKRNIEVSEIIFFNEHEKDIFMDISHFKEYDNIVIAIHKNSFASVSKIISTAINDSLIAKDGLLMPSSAISYTDGSYLIEVAETIINCIEIEESKKIPKIFITEPKEYKVINIFDIDDESIKVLFNPIASMNGVSIEVSKVVSNWNKLIIKSNKFGEIDNFISQISTLFSQKIVTEGDIVKYIIAKFTLHDKSISFAESCTGGLGAYMFTKEAGSSNIFNGSVIAYSNRIKQVWLKVDEATLIKNGAVSEQVVDEMLDGILALTNSNYAIAFSGVAGPTGGTVSKPIGTVYVGVKSNKGEKIVERLHLEGDRNYIQSQAANHGIYLLVNIAKEILL